MCIARMTNLYQNTVFRKGNQGVAKAREKEEREKGKKSAFK